ncbi:orotidine-5'-phosphate decarboxylase [Salimicrobium salexigens]|uniref:Orotidine 5'-phosphate decarboxylase n=1 Tax=Salimicrobium salexigens TaxID=908941 RepID=A0ABY1KPM1_9BACI|nr:orotidine-5'-phosphate decarboxylase [Salimicrobium salexigens]SIS62038.1 orotidine-5'-phosphate decarboxylase [Salimicrobium salexigens]
MKTLRPLYIALDFPGKEEALEFLEAHNLEKVPVKVGMQLFYKEGPAIVRELRKRGHPVFLDVKVHDIPATAEGAVKSLVSLDVEVLTVHAQGGKEMMKRAGRAAGDTVVLAVTQLTSVTEEMLNRELGISSSLKENVMNLALQAQECGMDGVVCSVHEAKMINTRVKKEFLTLTPGIRTETESKHDQKRAATPEEARREGATAIVVGRAVTEADNPKEIYEAIRREIG